MDQQMSTFILGVSKTESDKQHCSVFSGLEYGGTEYSLCPAAALLVLSKPFYSGSLLSTTAQMFSGALYPRGVGLHMQSHVCALKHNNTHI